MTHPANDNCPPLPVRPVTLRVTLVPPKPEPAPAITPLGVLMAVLAFVVTYAAVSALAL